MAKYDAQLAAIKAQLPQISNILVALPAQITTDKLASVLALSLALEKVGKKVSVVTEGNILVSHSNLYGIGNVKNSLAETGKGGNLTITLGGVVAQDGTVPSLEKLDWFPIGQDLNLVFHVISGQRFEPTKITPSYQGGKIDAIFVIGAPNLNELGAIYTGNQDTFASSQIINIDNSPLNTQYGATNIVDTNAASVSEIVMQVIGDLGLSLDQDSASNILAGIYDATSNLTANVKPDTFMVVSQAMQLGGKVSTTSQIPQSSMLIAQPAPMPEIQPVAPQQQTPQAQSQQTKPAQPSSSTNFFKFITPTADNFTFAPSANQNEVQPIQPPVAQPMTGDPSLVSSAPVIPSPQSSIPQTNQSTQERPSGEYASSSSVEAPQQPSPDWLTPKVYKGGSLG